MAVKLDTAVTDRITGFKGVATSRTEFLHGCVRIGIQPKKLVAGKRADVDYIDELQLVENNPKMTPDKNEIIGKLVTDSISGFKGIVTHRTEYINASPRVCIQPKSLHEGKPVESLEFDESQLVEYKAPKQSRPGGPGQMARPHRMAPRN